MSNSYLKESLVNEPETEVKVSAELHRNIMRAVRLAEPVSKKPALFSVIPALGAAVLAVLVVGVFISRPLTTEITPSATPQQGISQNLSADSTLGQLADELLILSKNSTVPEQELRKELERLKSDLERFDFRS